MALEWVSQPQFDRIRPPVSVHVRDRPALLVAGRSCAMTTPGSRVGGSQSSGPGFSINRPRHIRSRACGRLVMLARACRTPADVPAPHASRTACWSRPVPTAGALVAGLAVLFLFSTCKTPPDNSHPKATLYERVPLRLARRAPRVSMWSYAASSATRRIRSRSCSSARSLSTPTESCRRYELWSCVAADPVPAHVGIGLLVAGWISIASGRDARSSSGSECPRRSASSAYRLAYRGWCRARCWRTRRLAAVTEVDHSAVRPLGGCAPSGSRSSTAETLMLRNRRAGLRAR